MFIFGNSVRIFMAKLFDNNFKMLSLSLPLFISCLSVSDDVVSNEDDDDEQWKRQAHFISNIFINNRIKWGTLFVVKEFFKWIPHNI